MTWKQTCLVLLVAFKHTHEHATRGLVACLKNTQLILDAQAVLSLLDTARSRDINVMLRCVRGALKWH